jgi:hypothetical protein
VVAHVESQKNNEKVALADQRMWSLKECTEVLFKAIKEFWQDEERRGTVGSTEFDKDDALALVS